MSGRKVPGASGAFGRAVGVVIAALLSLIVILALIALAVFLGRFIVGAL